MCNICSHCKYGSRKSATKHDFRFFIQFLLRQLACRGAHDLWSFHLYISPPEVSWLRVGSRRFSKATVPMSAQSAGWPSGDGQIAELMRTLDWAAAPMGPQASWPQSLRTLVNMMLSSTVQRVVFWGPDYVTLYNDAYATTIGSKHPGVPGQPAAFHCNELSDDLKPLLDSVCTTGETQSAHDRPFKINRNGYAPPPATHARSPNRHTTSHAQP